MAVCSYDVSQVCASLESDQRWAADPADFASPHKAGQSMRHRQAAGLGASLPRTKAGRCVSRGDKSAHV